MAKILLVIFSLVVGSLIGAEAALQFVIQPDADEVEKTVKARLLKDAGEAYINGLKGMFEQCVADTAVGAPSYANLGEGASYEIKCTRSTGGQKG